MWECIKLAVGSVAIVYGILFSITFTYQLFKGREELKTITNDSLKKYSTGDKIFYGFFTILILSAWILN